MLLLFSFLEDLKLVEQKFLFSFDVCHTVQKSMSFWLFMNQVLETAVCRESKGELIILPEAGK